MGLLLVVILGGGLFYWQSGGVLFEWMGFGEKIIEPGVPGGKIPEPKKPVSEKRVTQAGCEAAGGEWQQAWAMITGEGDLDMSWCDCPDGSEFYLEGEKCLGAVDQGDDEIEGKVSRKKSDIDPFEIKEGQVYLKEVLLEGVDPVSFEVLEEHYGKDKNGVYYFEGNYLYGSSYKSENFLFELIEEADVETFRVFEETEGLYARDKNHVYNLREVIEGADPATFEFLGSDLYGYQKDKNRVYSQGTVIEGVDPATFEYFPCPRADLRCNYFKDKDAVYFDSVLGINELTEYDPVTFMIYSEGMAYMRNKDKIYYEMGDWEEIVEADAATFEIIEVAECVGKSFDEYPMNLFTYCAFGSPFAKDKNYVYEDGEIVEGANPETFNLSVFLASRLEEEKVLEDRVALGLVLSKID